MVSGGPLSTVDSIKVDRGVQPRREMRNVDTRQRVEERTTLRNSPGPVLTASTPFAYPQVVSRCFACFRVVKSSVFAAHAILCAWFDSRQLHEKGTGQSHKLWPVFFFSTRSDPADSGRCRSSGVCRSSGTVCIRAAEHADYGDLPQLVIDSVNHAVGTATCAVAIEQRWSELFANSVGIDEQRTDDELVGRKRHRFGKLFG